MSHRARRQAKLTGNTGCLLTLAASQAQATDGAAGCSKLAWALFGLIPLVPFLHMLTGGDQWSGRRAAAPMGRQAGTRPDLCAPEVLHVTKRGYRRLQPAITCAERQMSTLMSLVWCTNGCSYPDRSVNRARSPGPFTGWLRARAALGGQLRGSVGRPSSREERRKKLVAAARRAVNARRLTGPWL